MTPVALPGFVGVDGEAPAAPLPPDRSPEAMTRLREPFRWPDANTGDGPEPQD